MEEKQQSKCFAVATNMNYSRNSKASRETRTQKRRGSQEVLRGRRWSERLAQAIIKK